VRICACVYMCENIMLLVVLRLVSYLWYFIALVGTTYVRHYA